MDSLWSENAARLCENDVELRVYTSRLLGAERSLVLHGGGNTSVKLASANILGEQEDILFVKGSGWDLATIEAAGFAPVRMAHLKKLAQLPALADSQMLAELVAHTTTPGAPVPSVEAILHAVLPYKFVDHTHADAVVTVTNSKDGEACIREIYGDQVVVIPYVMPGFDLAREIARRFPEESGPRTIGIILLNHGVFSFGDTARESYERMIELVSLSENYLKLKNAWPVAWDPRAYSGAVASRILPQLRRDISGAAGFSVVLASHTGEECMGFAQRGDLATVAAHGPATPDHVIRTKRIPMIGRDVEGYANEYREYFRRHEANARDRKTMLDPAPRVVLDPELGMCTVGRSAADAAVVADIYTRTIDMIVRASTLGGYRALPERDIFDVEYWDLEQAKLARAGKPRQFAGEVVLITGAASGIGSASVTAFLARGAAVVGLDVDPGVASLHERADFVGVECDITSSDALQAAFQRAIHRYGGLDMVVLNAGIFPPGRTIEHLSAEQWRSIMDVNLNSNFEILRMSYPLLKLAYNGGRVVVIGSKNVPAPGPGAAAYSASKAGLNQLARVAALEWGGDGIRINSLHPHGVFDTGLWTEEILASRAKQYGMSVDAYRKKNVLGTEVRSRDVGELAAELCGPLFSKCTGLQIPIDGGNDRVI